MLELDEKLLDYIEKETEKYGYPPSVRDIQNALGIKSTSTVHTHLRRLQNSGRLIKVDGKSRALRVVRSDAPANGVISSDVIPFLVRVTPDVPLLSPENYSGSVAFPTNLPGVDTKSLFCVKVRDDLMSNAGIMAGDVVVVQAGEAGQSGDIVVALIDDAPVVRRYYAENQFVVFQSDNAGPPTIGNSSMILGRVVTVVRYFT